MSAKIFLLLGFIVVGGAFIRLINLDKIPAGFYVDEAAIGYNAYSILQTGKDEYGKSFPIFLRSYGVYASPLYTYLTVISVGLLNLNIFSIRILSAISGTVSIILIYLIFKQINLFKNPLMPLLGSVVFAFSPWSIFFSRGAFEANLALMLLLLGILFLQFGLKKTPFLVPAFLFLSLSTYAYQAERLIVYLLISAFILLFTPLKKILKQKSLLLAAAFFLITQLPYLYTFFTPAFSVRQSGLFYNDVIKAHSLYLAPLIFVREFFAQFISFLSPRNLFFQPDSDLQRSFPTLSVFYSWLVIPYLVGFYYLIKRLTEKNVKFIIVLIISFIFPVALTKDPFSTLRALPLILPICLIITLGLEKLLSLKHKYLSYVVILIFCTLSFISLFRNLFLLMPHERARIWGYGFSQLAKEIGSHPNDKFLIDGSRIKPAYIELAFFLKYPPDKFQQSVDQNIKDNYYTKPDWNPHYNFDQIETRGINFEIDIYQAKILVGDSLAISEDQANEHFLTKVFEIKDPLKDLVFVGFKTNPKLKCKQNYIDYLCKEIL